MKICFWVSHVATVGGVQRVTAVISRELSERHEITVISNDSDDDIKKNIYKLPENVRILKEPKGLTRIPTAKKILKRINKLTGIFNKESRLKAMEAVYVPESIKAALVTFFNSFDFDCIVGVQGFNSLFLASVSDRLSAKTVGWQHKCFSGYFRSRNRYFWNQDELFKKYLRRLDGYVVLNDDDKADVDREFEINSTVIHNPRSFTSEEKCDPYKKSFIASGRFVYSKGFDLLIEALSLFARKNRDWDCILVGDGIERPKIERLIRKKKIADRIIMTGYTDDIKKYFLKASVLVMPSREEGMPMTILEAFELGCPVIAFDIDAVRPLLRDEKDGLIVKRSEGAVGLAKAMSRLSEDTELRVKMHRNVILKAEEFDLKKTVQKWEKEIFNLV